MEQPPQKVSRSGDLPRSEPVLQTYSYALQLPPEMLVNIFQKLSVRDKGRVVQVCTAWRDASYNRMVWHHLEVVVKLNGSVDQYLIPSLALRGVHKVKVTALREHLLCDLMDGIPTLTDLSLCGCKELSVKTVLSAFSKERFLLMNLHVKNCPNFTDTSLSLVTINFENLGCLHLESCAQLTDMSLLLIATGLLNLKTLNLNNNILITDQGIGHLSGIDGLPGDGYCQLIDLSLCYFDQLTDQSLRYLSEGQTNLEVVDLQFCGGFRSAGLRHLSKMSKLRTLCLIRVNFDDDVLFELSTGKVPIKNLYLGNNGILTDEGMRAIGKMINLCWLELIACSKITDVGLCNMAEQQSKITALQIRECLSITNMGLIHVTKLPCLEKLVLSGGNIQLGGLYVLVHGQSKITSLNLTGCKAIRNSALDVIASGLFSMQTLKLAVHHVDNVGIDRAASTLTRLTSLVSGGTELIGEIVKIRKTFC